MAYCIKCGLKGFHLELQCNSKKFYLFPPIEKRALSQDSAKDQHILNKIGSNYEENKSEFIKEETHLQRSSNTARSLSSSRNNSKQICDTKLKNILEKYLPEDNTKKKSNKKQQEQVNRQETKDILSRFMNEE